MSDEPIYVGIDAGGTSTRVAVQRGDELSEHTGPAAQLQRMGVQATAGVLARLVRSALSENADTQVHSLVAGVAGAGAVRDQTALAAALSGALESKLAGSVRIVQDAEVALVGAFEGASGMIVIAGTGTVVAAREANGAFHKAGGWGYLLGDEGSGYTLGLEALRAVARAMDGGPSTLLQIIVEEDFEVLDRAALIERVYRTDWPLQELAPLVLDAAQRGDAVARRILLEQTRALARQTRRLADQHPGIVPRIALLGGLTESELYNRTLTSALRTLLPDWDVQPPQEPPVMGALRLARQSKKQSSSKPASQKDRH